MVVIVPLAYSSRTLLPITPLWPRKHTEKHGIQALLSVSSVCFRGYLSGLGLNQVPFITRSGTLPWLWRQALPVIRNMRSIFLPIIFLTGQGCDAEDAGQGQRIALVLAVLESPAFQPLMAVEEMFELQLAVAYLDIHFMNTVAVEQVNLPTFADRFTGRERKTEGYASCNTIGLRRLDTQQRLLRASACDRLPVEGLH